MLIAMPTMPVPRKEPSKVHRRLKLCITHTVAAALTTVAYAGYAGNFHPPSNMLLTENEQQETIDRLGAVGVEFSAIIHQMQDIIRRQPVVEDLPVSEVPDE